MSLEKNTVPAPSDDGKPLCSRVECVAPCEGCFEDQGRGFLYCHKFDTERHVADENECDAIRVPKRRYRHLVGVATHDRTATAAVAAILRLPTTSTIAPVVDILARHGLALATSDGDAEPVSPVLYWIDKAHAAERMAKAWENAGDDPGKVKEAKELSLAFAARYRS